MEILDNEAEVDLAPRVAFVAQVGGLAVCAGGPEKLIQDVANALARI
jgi:hypothetical protein